MTTEELVLLIDLLDKLGYNTEGAGTGTVFQRLAQIAGYTDTLESNLGTTADAANASGSVLARLAELLTNRLTAARAGYLDRLDATVSSRASSSAIGTSSDTRASNTVMGWLNTQVKSWQRVTFTPSANPYNVTISSVNPSKCIVLLNGLGVGTYTIDATPYVINLGYYISNFTSTSLSVAVSAGTPAAYGTLSAVIIEFY